jgi:chemotaxis protein MotB
LDFPDLQVELSEESDALRFQGEGLFASGSSNLRSQKSAIIARLSQRLDEVLPCFTIGPASVFSEVCNPGFVMIEAVQIEGHTDNVGTDVVNRTLSASRANNTFFAMTRAATRIIEHRNLKSQPVLSVAAYGPDRPVTSNDSPAGRATNRRIDLRFIMITPQDTDGIATIRDALSSISEIQQ